MTRYLATALAIAFAFPLTATADSSQITLTWKPLNAGSSEQSKTLTAIGATTATTPSSSSEQTQDDTGQTDETRTETDDGPRRDAVENEGSLPRPVETDVQLSRRERLLRKFGWVTPRLMSWKPDFRSWSIHGQHPWSYHRQDQQYQRTDMKYHPIKIRKYHYTEPGKYERKPVRKYTGSTL